MGKRLDSAATILLALAAVVVAGIMISDRLSPTEATIGDQSVKLLPDWEKALAMGTPVTSDRRNAVRIIEFLDVECPFCAKYDATMLDVERSLGDSVQLVLVHMPLPGHKYAESGAKAVECASRHGDVRKFITQVFGKQDSLGLESWAHFAVEAGITDTVAFNQCANSESVATKVANASNISRELRIPGTPTLLIEGWRYSNGQSADEIKGAVRAVFRGDAPK